MQTERPTTLVPMTNDVLWTMLRSYLETITGDSSGRLPAQSRVAGIATMLEAS